MVSEGEVGKEEEERREEEGVRVGQDEEGRETESDDGTPRPNGGTSQVNENKFFGKEKLMINISFSPAGRNRRKPLAPQWVNPAEWTAADRAEELAGDKVIFFMIVDANILKAKMFAG